MQNNENEVIFLCPEMEDVKISCIAIRTWKGISLFLVLIFACTFLYVHIFLCCCLRRFTAYQTTLSGDIMGMINYSRRVSLVVNYRKTSVAFLILRSVASGLCGEFHTSQHHQLSCR